MQVFWERVCGEMINATEGFLASVNYPDRYENDLQCAYVIQAEPQDYVTIQFLEPFGLEEGEGDTLPLLDPDEEVIFVLLLTSSVVSPLQTPTAPTTPCWSSRTATAKSGAGSADPRCRPW